MSTVEWQSAHWMPADFKLPSGLKNPVTPTGAGLSYARLAGTPLRSIDGADRLTNEIVSCRGTSDSHWNPMRTSSLRPSGAIRLDRSPARRTCRVQAFWDSHKERSSGWVQSLSSAPWQGPGPGPVLTRRWSLGPRTQVATGSSTGPVGRFHPAPCALSSERGAGCSSRGQPFQQSRPTRPQYRCPRQARIAG